MSRKYSILLVEDSRADVLLVGQALEQAGLQYELHVVQDGSSAATLLETLGAETPQPDVVLMDLNLPKVDGLELIRQLKANPRCNSVPVIAVTSSDAPRDRARTRELGVSEYFRKPLELAEFMLLGSLVRSVLERSDGGVGSR